MTEFAQLDLKRQLDVIHEAIFGWPLDHASPIDDLTRSASLQEATHKLLRSERVQGLLGETRLQFERLDRKSQLDIVHTALFGWPLDHLSPTEELLQSDTLQAATHKLINTPRGRFVMRDSVPLWPSDKWVCADYFGLRIWVNLFDSYVARGVLENNWEVDEVQFMLDRLAPGDVMVDAGANVGVYTLQAARAVGPAGKVYAFEPQADTFAMLSRSVGDNGFAERVVLDNCALGDRDGIAAIWRHHSSNPGASFIAAELVEGAGNATALKRLDAITFDRAVKLLKMDIEGYEPLLVKGAQRFLREHRPTIITEWFPRSMQNVAKSSSFDYFEMLVGLRYKVFLLDGRSLAQEMTLESLPGLEAIAEPINIACVPD